MWNGAEEEKQQEVLEGSASSHLLLDMDKGSHEGNRNKSILGLLKSTCPLLKRRLECNYRFLSLFNQS